MPNTTSEDSQLSISLLKPYKSNIVFFALFNFTTINSQLGATPLLPPATSAILVPCPTSSEVSALWFVNSSFENSVPKQTLSSSLSIVISHIFNILLVPSSLINSSFLQFIPVSTMPIMVFCPLKSIGLSLSLYTSIALLNSVSVNPIIIGAPAINAPSNDPL